MEQEFKIIVEDFPTGDEAVVGNSQKSPVTSSHRKKLRYLPILVMAVAIVVTVIIFVDKPTDFQSYIKNSGYSGVLLMGIIGSTSPLWPLPGSWSAFIAGGLGLNPIVLAFVAGTGEAIGELTAYMAGYGGQGAVTSFKKYERVESWMKRNGPITIFLASAVPNNFIKIAVVAAGALRYPLWKFFLLCWSGKTIKSFGFAMVGAGFFTAILEMLERIF